MLQQPFEAAAVSRLGEILANTVRDLIADIAHRAQFVLAGVAHRLDRLEAHRKRPRGALADMANSEAVDQAIDRAMARALDRVEQIPRALFGHPFQPGELLALKAIDVVELLDHTVIDQLAHELVAEAVDVHAVLRSEMTDRFAHPCGAVDVDAK